MSEQQSAPAAEEAVVSPESQEVEGQEQEAQDSAPAAAEEEAPKAKAESEAEKVAKAEQAKLGKKKLSVKAYGKVKDVELDLDNEEELQKYMSKALAFEQSTQKYSQLEKEVTDLLGQLKGNPRAVLRELGISEKELAESIVTDLMEEAKKSPEQLELEKARKELEGLKKEKEEAEKRRQEEEFARQLEKEQRDIEDSMIKAIEKHSLKPSAGMIKRTAEYLELALRNNIDVSPEDVMPLVIQDLKGDIKQFVSEHTDEVLEEFVTKERLGAYRKKALAKAKEVAAATASPSNAKATGQSEARKAQPAEKKEEKRITVRDWLKS